MQFIARLRFTVGILSLCGLSAQAQNTPPPTAPAATTTPPVASLATPAELLPPTKVSGRYSDYLMTRYANDKEARAAIHMFGRKTTGGGIWLGAGAVFTTLILTQTGTHKTSSGGSYTVTVSPLGYVAFIGLPLVLGINKLSRFGNQSLYKVLQDYDKTQTFPRYVAARIHGKDYK